MRNKPRPCPFCGGDARIHVNTHSDWWWIKCEDCSAEIDGARPKTAAIAVWNRRISDPDRASGSAVLPHEPDATAKTLDEALGILRWIQLHFPDQDMTHEAFRIGVAWKAEVLLTRIANENDRAAEIERASQSHAPEIPGEVEGEDA